jgi:hypothetical protein
MEAFSSLTKGIADFKPSPHASTLFDLLATGIKIACKAKRKADKADWIKAHGSSHLKRAHGNGYDAQRLYVTERAETEAPGFTVDFDEKAEWRGRTCPTLEALDAEAEAEALGIGEEVMVVWLINQACNGVQGQEGYYDVFDACEAIVIRNYLGQLYDLVREL